MKVIRYFPLVERIIIPSKNPPPGWAGTWTHQEEYNSPSTQEVPKVAGTADPQEAAKPSARGEAAQQAAE